MGSSSPVEDDAGLEDGSAKDVAESPGSIMNRRRAAKMPSSFSSNLGNRSSSTLPPLARKDVHSECEVSRTTGGRSVKSIVRWIETSKQAPPASPKSVMSEASQNSSTKTEKTTQKLPSAESFIPLAPEVEDDSLAYLNYKNFFTEVPLGRCLDGVTEDLSKIPLESIFENAGKGLASEKTRVSLIGSTNDGGELSSRTKTAVAAETEEGCRVASRDTPSEATDLANSQETGAETQGSQEFASGSVEALHASHRDPQEVNRYWTNIRSHMNIPDDEIGFQSAESEWLE